MAATIPRPPSTPDTDTDDDGSFAVWGFLWVLFAFKMATVGLIFYFHQTWETGAILGITTWYWFPPMALLLAGPVLFRVRLRRVRARREQLRRAEWLLTDDQPAEPTPARGR